jgi:hypothetical protein
MDGEGLGGLIVAIIGIALVIAAIIAIISVITTIAMVCGASGALFGSGVSIGNYYRSFSENVSLEKPTI